MPPRLACAALAALNLLAAPAFAADEITYLQNALDGRGRCLASAHGAVAMAACDQSPAQQWVLTPGALPGYVTFHTVADGAGTCLEAQPADGKNVLHMVACGKADAQQWYVARQGYVPRRMHLTNRAAGSTRCLEAQQAGIKLTPCGRKQPGHQWRSESTPTM
ncbi:RICIN domain-containing protein [uncultured Massilia sp.]|uniref:RICIN domain-containing protein n=1 Tax=uncultured Massilia sp. TaxID=169973 RepID=UPI0025F97C3E|nr:RICIN domain-containing protein [uncultured Massilia sp.]